VPILRQCFKKASGSDPYTRRVRFKQFIDPDLGCASYLIADDATSEAVVVDPAYAIEQYVDEAERWGVQIARVIETHNHADHVSGHGRLALEHGARVSIHPLAEPEYGFDAIRDGDELRAGEVTLRVLHTPGHRPEHCAILVGDQLVLTGDSLFVGDAARPDLAVGAAEGAEGLFRSLKRLAELPEGVAVYPGHVAGSLCGASMSADPSSTIGRERRINPALRIRELDDFVANALAKNAPRPPNMDRIVALNRGPFVGAQPELERLDDTGGATVLDVREARSFAAGHLHGALNVPLDGSSFSTRAGFVLDETPVVIQADSAEQAQQAARGLRAIAVFQLTGYVVDPPGAAERIEPIDLDELERLLAEDAVEVLDVREADERDAGYIAGSRHIPFRLVGALSEGLPTDRPVVTICESGTRAAIAASVLAARGLEARPVLRGGVPDWEQRGRPTVEFRRCGS
jgi:glyoxylase-like metal-dependent hydrolase (beta-lactamase superfamily II)/rhodanese-related sulfurtransferase